MNSESGFIVCIAILGCFFIGFCGYIAETIIPHLMRFLGGQ